MIPMGNDDDAAVKKSTGKRGKQSSLEQPDRCAIAPLYPAAKGKNSSISQMQDGPTVTPILPSCSMRNRQREWLMLLGAMALTAVAIVLGICLGSTQISPASFFQALLSGGYRQPGLSHCGTQPVAAGAGRSAGRQCAGGVRRHLQAVLQNPLASPNIIGVNTGAGLLVLLCSAFFPSREGLLPFAAFLGALLTALLIFALAMGNGVSKVTLVLTGIAMSSILGAGMNCILILYPRRQASAPAPFGGRLIGGHAERAALCRRLYSGRAGAGYAPAPRYEYCFFRQQRRPRFGHERNADSLSAHCHCRHFGRRRRQLCRTFWALGPDCAPRHPFLIGGDNRFLVPISPSAARPL